MEGGHACSAIFSNSGSVPPTGIQTVGLPLVLNGVLVNIWAKVGYLLGDGDGLRMALQWLSGNEKQYQYPTCRAIWAPLLPLPSLLNYGTLAVPDWGAESPRAAPNFGFV